jgi:hypothetical protein
VNKKAEYLLYFVQKLQGHELKKCFFLDFSVFFLQINLSKIFRRRGKNLVAAHNCRRRKFDEIEVTKRLIRKIFLDIWFISVGDYSTYSAKNLSIDVVGHLLSIEDDGVALSVCVVEFEFCNRGRCRIFDEIKIMVLPVSSSWPECVTIKHLLVLALSRGGLWVGGRKKGVVPSFLAFLEFFKSVTEIITCRLLVVGCRGVR